MKAVKIVSAIINGAIVIAGSVYCVYGIYFYAVRLF